MARPITPPAAPTEPVFTHGGRLEAAGARLPDAPRPLIDLSTGINPIAYPVRRLDAACFTRLPEPEAVERLQGVAAERYGVTDPAMVVAAPGTQIVIELLPRVLQHLSPRLGPRHTVAILGPTYGEYEAAWARAGWEIVPITSLDGFAGQDGLILCNPNNPDGRTHSPAMLRTLADRLAARGGMLIIDEAFADFMPGISLAPSLPHPAIVILRSFGKSYGLAGLRLGFALAAPATAGILRRELGPWAVSGPAIAVATEALADDAWLAAAGQRLNGDAKRLDDRLYEAGLIPIGGTSLFRLTDSPAASQWYDRLAEAGIITRAFPAHPSWLRFGLPGKRAAWRRVERALRSGRVERPRTTA